MHEMSIAMQVVEIATASIPGDLDDPRVEKINLKVGKLSAVVPESLRFCFEIITKNTQFEGTTLAIEEVPVTAKCRECAHTWTISNPTFLCEQCGSGNLHIISGRELDISSIEIAD